MHNSVQSWIEYREWARYPEEWNFVERMIREIHDRGIPAGVVYGYHAADVAARSYDDNEGFLYYYRSILPQDKKWRYPNGSVAGDPYSVGASRQFTGAYATRIYGSARDLKIHKEVTLYFAMQLQNPYWRDFFVEWGKEAIDRGADSFFIDSPDGIFTFYWGGGWGCADMWEGYLLAQHLRRTLGEETLSRLGISSIENFCLPKYLENKYEIRDVFSDYAYIRERFKVSWPTEVVNFRNVEAVLSGPVFKEVLVYWYRSAIDFVKSVAKELKDYGRQRGKDVLLTSNEYLAWIPHITLTPYMDVIYVETNQFNVPPYQTNSIFCKLAQAAGNYSKRVWVGEWVSWFSNPFDPYNPPRDISNLVKLKVAEAYSSGCLMLIPFGTGWVDEGWPPKRLVLGSERQQVSRYYRFIADNRELFRDVNNMADVAILVSIPTAVWRKIPALGVRESINYQEEILGWAIALENIHIPYQALMLGMDRIFNTDSSERLERYSLVIAPHLTHISEKDLEKIEKYIEKGEGSS
ncbi:MAG: hypothetical protein NXY59_01870 [Aigarchaeota archaeon]|nr:hypothetical protein [Candidatus Pelearchaeum maunauluense]